MKKLLLMAASLLVGGLGCYANTACETENDTIIVVNRPEKVTVEKTDNSLSVRIEGSADNPNYLYAHKMTTDSAAVVITEEKNKDWDFTIPFIKKNKKRTYYNHGDRLTAVGFGLVDAVDAPEGMNVDMGASYEIMIDNLVKAVCYLRSSTSVSVGFGMTWRNYRMTGYNRFVQEGSNLVLGEYPEGADINFSRLKVFSLTVPFLLNQNLGRRALFSVGPVINFNTHGSLKTRYKLDGEKIKEKSNEIHQNRVTVDFMARLSLRRLGLYVKYSPGSMLNTEFGPEFRSLSVGMICTL